MAKIITGSNATAPTPAAPVTSVFGRIGAVVANIGDYVVAQITGAAPLASPTFTGTPAAPTPATADNTTKLATTAFVKAQGYAAPSGTVNQVQINNGAGAFTANANLINDGTNTKLGSGAQLQWDNAGTPDLKLQRDAANTLALINGTVTQILRVYRAFTDATHYGRIALNANAINPNLSYEAAGGAPNNQPFYIINQTGGMRFVVSGDYSFQNVNFNNVFAVNATSGSESFQLTQPGAATSTISKSAPPIQLMGQYWTGAATATDQWNIQPILTNGTNGPSILKFTHPSGTTGFVGVEFPTVVKVGVFAVAGLPSAVTAGVGSRAFVTDSNATIAAGLGNTVAAGGANKVPVYSDGANWIIG